MIDYKNYELMTKCLIDTFKVYSVTLDTLDYVPKSHLEKIHKWIVKSMKKKQRLIDKEDRKYRRSLKKLIKMGVVVDTTSLEYVLGDIDPSYVNFHRAPSILSGQSSTVAPTENTAEENVATVPEENSSGENVSEENAEATASAENVVVVDGQSAEQKEQAEGETNVEENK